MIIRYPDKNANSEEKQLIVSFSRRTKGVFIKKVTFEICCKDREEGKSHSRHKKKHLKRHKNIKGIEFSRICKKFSLTEVILPEGEIRVIMKKLPYVMLKHFDLALNVLGWKQEIILAIYKVHYNYMDNSLEGGKNGFWETN